MATIRFISNGHGEDGIACALIRALPSHVNLSVYPMVGEGHAYRALGLSPRIQQPILPSGGFLRRPWDVIRDVWHGLFGQLIRQRRSLSESSVDCQCVVGDVFALVMACLGNDSPTMFFPTAKSERAIPHSLLEYALIKRYATAVFPRDMDTHEAMMNRGIVSHFFGNPMFDGIESALPPNIDRTIVLLPGSRQESRGNLLRLLEVVAHLNINDPWDVLVALSPQFTSEHLAQLIANSEWSMDVCDDGSVLRFGDRQVMVTHAFFDALHQARVVIGLAGTANEQAMFAKRLLISFVGTGPQSTKARFKQQHALIIGADTLFIDAVCPKQIAQAVSTRLNAVDVAWEPLPPVQNAAHDIILAMGFQ